MIRPLLLGVCLVAPLYAIDLTWAVGVAPSVLSRPEAKKAVAMLLDEVEKRTQVRWQVAHSRPAGTPRISRTWCVGPASMKTSDPRSSISCAPAGHW